MMRARALPLAVEHELPLSAAERGNCMTKTKRPERGGSKPPRETQTHEPETAAPEETAMTARTLPRKLPKPAKAKIAVGRQMVEEPETPPEPAPKPVKKAAAKQTETKPVKPAAKKGKETPKAGPSHAPATQARPRAKPQRKAAMPPSNGSAVPSYADVTISHAEPAPDPEPTPVPEPAAEAKPAPEPAPPPEPVAVAAVMVPAPVVMMPPAPQETVDSFRASLAAAGRGAAAVNAALIDMARDSVNAELDLFAALAGVRSPSQALKLHMAFWEGRVQALQTQSRALQTVSAEAFAATAAPICAQMRRSLGTGL
jgi:hypothetical protein